MEAQITFASVAASLAVSQAMNLFRYKSASDYYDSGSVLPFNSWKLGNKTIQWTGFVTGCVLTLTSILSLFGVAPKLNFFSWMILGSLADVATFVGILGLAYAYDQAYQLVRDSSDADAAVVYDTITTEAVELTVMLYAIALTMFPVAEDWFHGTVYASNLDQERWGDKIKMIDDMFDMFEVDAFEM